jgi:hypothetical protein
MCHILVPRRYRRGKPNIQSTRYDSIDLVNREQMLHNQLHVWLLPPKVANGVRNHPMPRQRRGDSNSKRTGFAEGDPLSAPLGILDILQDALRIAEKQFSRRTQPDSSRQSVE